MRPGVSRLLKLCVLGEFYARFSQDAQVTETLSIYTAIHLLRHSRQVTLNTLGCRMKVYKQSFGITIGFFKLHRVRRPLHRGLPVNVLI